MSILPKAKEVKTKEKIYQLVEQEAVCSSFLFEKRTDESIKLFKSCKKIRRRTTRSGKYEGSFDSTNR